MGLDVLAAPLISKESNDVTTGVKALRTNRYLATAITSSDTDVTGAAYALISADHEIDLLGAPGAAIRIILDDGSTGNDKIAVKIYGSVDGTNYSDVWHERITGSIDPIINDYGAVNKVLDFSSGLRKIQLWGIRTYTGTLRSSAQIIGQPKFEAVIPNQAELIKKVVDACFDLSRGQVGANVTNWPSNNVTPYNFADNGGTPTAAATVYYPSATGMSLAGIKDLSITGKLIAGTADNTLTFTQEVCNDEDTTLGDWQPIGWLDDMTGTPEYSIVVNNATRNLAIPNRGIGVYANYRIKLIIANTGVLTNTIIIKGNGVGGA